MTLYDLWLTHRCAIKHAFMLILRPAANEAAHSRSACPPRRPDNLPGVCSATCMDTHTKRDVPSNYVRPCSIGAHVCGHLVYRCANHTAWWAQSGWRSVLEIHAANHNRHPRLGSTPSVIFIKQLRRRTCASALLH